MNLIPGKCCHLIGRGNVTFLDKKKKEIHVGLMENHTFLEEMNKIHKKSHNIKINYRSINAYVLFREE